MIVVYVIWLSSIVSSPPKLPPVVVKNRDNNDGWNIVPLDLQTASELLSDFSKSYEVSDLTPNCSCNPLQTTTFPQGMLALKRGEKHHMVLHYLEKKAGVAHISSIASPSDCQEIATVQLFKQVKNHDFLKFDLEILKEKQPTWYLKYKFSL
jgi:hypothetical protein